MRIAEDGWQIVILNPCGDQKRLAMMGVVRGGKTQRSEQTRDVGQIRIDLRFVFRVGGIGFEGDQLGQPAFELGRCGGVLASREKGALGHGANHAHMRAWVTAPLCRLAQLEAFV